MENNPNIEIAKKIMDWEIRGVAFLEEECFKMWIDNFNPFNDIYQAVDIVEKLKEKKKVVNIQSLPDCYLAGVLGYSQVKDKKMSAAIFLAIIKMLEEQEE